MIKENPEKVYELNEKDKKKYYLELCKEFNPLLKKLRTSKRSVQSVVMKGDHTIDKKKTLNFEIETLSFDSLKTLDEIGSKGQDYLNHFENFLMWKKKKLEAIIKNYKDATVGTKAHELYQKADRLDFLLAQALDYLILSQKIDTIALMKKLYQNSP